MDRIWSWLKRKNGLVWGVCRKSRLWWDCSFQSRLIWAYPSSSGTSSSDYWIITVLGSIHFCKYNKIGFRSKNNTKGVCQFLFFFYWTLMIILYRQNKLKTKKWRERHAGKLTYIHKYADKLQKYHKEFGGKFTSKFSKFSSKFISKFFAYSSASRIKEKKMSLRCC